jgi:hypothetical protein
MAPLKQEIRNETERGFIVQTLVDWALEWMPLREVKIQLIRRVGYMVEEAQVEYHLQYLERAGYAETKTLRAKQLGLELKAVRGTTKAVDLVEGRTAPDPAVAF